MAHLRKNFTDRQKAEIFVRDRATCCFSGANLWLLDSPLRPGIETDWVDHVVPSARGGGNDIGNGVCASHTYNFKKRHNSADNFYLFECGLPTSGFYEIFGPLPVAQEKRLGRLAKLRLEDWFFNRALIWVRCAFHDRCDREIYRSNYKRDADYWTQAGYRKLLVFQKIAQSESLEERGIVKSCGEISEQQLSLREAGSLKSFRKDAECLFPRYRSNFIAWSEYFWDAESEKERMKACEKAINSSVICPEVRECIKRDHQLRVSTNRADT